MGGRRMRLVMAGMVALFVAAWLVATGLGSGTVYYYTVDEIDLTADSTRVIRLAGTVMPGTLVWRPDGPELQFDLGPLPHGDLDAGEFSAAVPATASRLGRTAAAAPAAGDLPTTVPVRYQRLKPDLLAEGVEVVAEGTLVDGVFHATQLLVKCPSKYEAQLD